MMGATRKALSSYVNMLRHSKKNRRLKKAEDVALLFREPFILCDYRPPGKPWFNYLTSVFRIHNESGNIWSHALATIIFMCVTWIYCKDMNWKGSDKAFGLLGFGICVTLYAFLSTIAHMFHSKSERIHITSFQMDYIGIGLYGHGTGFLNYFCCGTPDFYQAFGNIYLPILSLLSVSVCVCCGYAKVKYRRPYPIQRRLLQLGVCAVQIIFLYIPLYYRMYHCSILGVKNDSDDVYLCDTLYNHTKYVFWFFPSIFFFSSHAPEKFLPGFFDLVGHSHQWFHVLITITTLYQFEAGYHDLNAQSHPVPSTAVQPTLVSVLGSITLVVMLDLLYIVASQNKVTEAIVKNRKLRLKGEPIDKLSQ